MTAAHTELQERELLELARLSAAIGTALRDRGVDDTTAHLAAWMGVLALAMAFARRTEPGNRRTYAEIADTTLREPQARAAALGADAEVRA